jgi:hypothetical protein
MKMIPWEECPFWIVPPSWNTWAVMVDAHQSMWRVSATLLSLLNQIAPGLGNIRCSYCKCSASSGPSWLCRRAALDPARHGDNTGVLHSGVCNTHFMRLLQEQW